MERHRKLNLSVDDYTTPNPLTVGPEAELSVIRGMMSDNDIRHLPVVENDKAIGIISDRDVHVLMTHSSEKSLTARDVMTPGPLSMKPTTPLYRAALELSKYKIGSALIVDDNESLIGIFTATDALNALIEISRGDYEKV